MDYVERWLNFDILKDAKKTAKVRLETYIIKDHVDRVDVHVFMIEVVLVVDKEVLSKMSKALFYKSENREDMTKDLWYRLTNVMEGGEIIGLRVVYSVNFKGLEHMKGVLENNDLDLEDIIEVHDETAFLHLGMAKTL